MKKNTRTRFNKSFKLRENLRQSPRLLKMALGQKKEKWAFMRGRLRSFFPGLIRRTPQSLRLLRLSRDFARRWREKQALKEHYLVQRENHWRRLTKLARTRTQSLPRKGELNLQLPAEFLSLWESRIDVCLWKSRLAPSLPAARQWILHGYVKVNGRKLKKQSKLLKAGDFLQICLPQSQQESWRDGYRLFFQQKSLSTTKGRPKQRTLKPNQRIPAHLEVHFGSMAFVFTEAPLASSLLFPYAISLEDLPINLGNRTSSSTGQSPRFLSARLSVRIRRGALIKSRIK